MVTTSLDFKFFIIITLLSYICSYHVSLTSNAQKYFNRQGIHQLYASAVSTKTKSYETNAFSNQNNAIASMNNIYKPHHLCTPLSDRNKLGQKLTWQNKRYLDLGLKLRSKYVKLKLLTEKEEIVAGRFSHVGKRLETIQKTLHKRLSREPTAAEWAKAAGLSSDQLELYLSLANRARNRLVQHNIRMVDHLVRGLLEHTNGGKEVSYYELVTEGIKGLTKAAENYDGRVRFYYYAQVFIRADLYRGLTRLRPGCLASHYSVLFSNKAKRVKFQLQATLNRKPSDEEIASELKVKVETLVSLRSEATKRVVSPDFIYKDASEDGRLPVSYFDLYMKNNDIDSIFWKSDFYDALSGCLSPIEKRVLDIRFGLIDGNTKSVERTAALMCLSAEGTRKIVIRALEKLRKSSSIDSLFAGRPKPSFIASVSGMNIIKAF